MSTLCFFACFQILSDIDDTFHASFKDCSYPGGIRYPGVQQFYEVLKEGKQPDQILGQLVFVTARPRIAKTYTHSAVRDHGSGDVTVLTGSFKNFLTHTRMANKKADNFRKYAELYPGTCSLYCRSTSCTCRLLLFLIQKAM